MDLNNRRDCLARDFVNMLQHYGSYSSFERAQKIASVTIAMEQVAARDSAREAALRERIVFGALTAALLALHELGHEEVAERIIRDAAIAEVR